MTDDLIRYGTLGGAFAITPGRIAELFKERDIRQIDEPLELEYLNGRKEKWPRALDYICYYVDLFRQWAYRRADGDKVLLQEIDSYIRDLYKWLKQGREKGRLDDIELERLKAFQEALKGKLYEYVPERLIAGGQASIKGLLEDIENSEHVTRYPYRPSDKWFDAEIIRLSLLSEKIKLLMRLVAKIHPENANKYHYLHYLDKVTGDIASYTGVLERSRDELYASIGRKDKIDLEEHFSKLDGVIDTTQKDIDRHFSELHERLAASKPLPIHEIIRAFKQYERSKDTSTLPPIRQLYKALRELKEPIPEDTSVLADFIVALSRAIRSEAEYHHWLPHEFSITEVLREIESIETGNHQRLSKELHNNSNTVGSTKKAPPVTSNQKDKPVRDQVFISYSRKDRRWLGELQTHLKPYRSVTTWSDDKISPGAEWFVKIKEALVRTKVGVLLVTPDFLASDFICEHELTPLLEEAKKGNVCIIWIPVSACSYMETLLARNQAAIDPSKPLAKMKKADRDKAWVEICEKIKQAISC